MQKRKTILPSPIAFDERLVENGLTDTAGFHSRGSGFRSDCTDTCWIDRRSGVEAEEAGVEEARGHLVEMETTVGAMEDACSGSSLLQFADGVTRDIRKLFRGVAYIYEGSWSSQYQDQCNLQGQGHCHCQGQGQCKGQIHFQRRLQSQSEGCCQSEGHGQDLPEFEGIWPSQGQELRQGQCQAEERNLQVNLQSQRGSRCPEQGDGRPPEEENGQHPGKFRATKYGCERCKNLGPMEELFKVIEEGDRDFWSTENRGSSTEAPVSHPGIPMSLRPLPASFWHQPSALPVPIGILSAPFWYPTVTSANPCQTIHLV